MSWRNQETHKAETKAVKEALLSAGIKAKVGHGTGTAWGWLHIRLADHGQEKEALRIAQQVTGRQGEYNGNINIFYDLN